MATFSVRGVRLGAPAPAALRSRSARAPRSAGVRPARTSASADVDSETGLVKARKGIKVAAEENVLTPRFYTTDFEEMDRLWAGEWNSRLNQEEMACMLAEFRYDYNQKHFVRNDSFRKAAESIRGPARKIFIEFLERSCTAEFSGFLLYKELGRRMKASNPVVAEIFTLMSRDEARHAGFLNKAMSDFDLALDLGFLTKNRTYTFFKPKFILYATYLSEKIGYWRYISIYRHLQANPNAQLYPIFQYFENWCQDENRHGDFFTALLKSQPKLVNDWEARIWSRFFCLSVYVTMYLNDHQRSEFYESLGLDTTQFNMHVLHQTNKTTALIFPEVIDTYNPQFKERLDHLVILNKRLIAGISNPLEKISVLASFAGELAGLFFMPTVRGGSIDIESASPEAQAALVY